MTDQKLLHEIKKHTDFLISKNNRNQGFLLHLYRTHLYPVLNKDRKVTALPSAWLSTPIAQYLHYCLPNALVQLGIVYDPKFTDSAELARFSATVSNPEDEIIVVDPFLPETFGMPLTTKMHVLPKGKLQRDYGLQVFNPSKFRDDHYFQMLHGDLNGLYPIESDSPNNRHLTELTQKISLMLLAGYSQNQRGLRKYHIPFIDGKVCVHEADMPALQRAAGHTLEGKVRVYQHGELHRIRFKK